MSSQSTSSQSTSTQRWDVIIVGSGAGGGTLAWRLAQTGKRVLILERGDWLPRERENWDLEEVNRKGRYRTHARWLDVEGNPFEPYTHAWVGGNTKMYGAALLRLRESDFGVVRHHGGVSPAWPVTYRDLEPYYSRAEALYSVHGLRGDDPLDPPSSAPYPHGPIPHEPRIERLAQDLRAQGLSPFSLPLGLRLPAGPEGHVRLSLFDGFPDPTRTKADVQVCAIEPALAHHNVSLCTMTTATRLLTSASGREITGVVVRTQHPTGELEESTLRADLYVVACGAIESAALFLRSANEAHPRGLANESGLVGRNYMAHQNGALLWVSPDARNDAPFQKTLGLTDWYADDGSGGLPLGAVQLMGRSDPRDLAELAKGVLEGWSAQDLAAHTVDFWLTTEDLPSRDNRVQLSRDGAIQLVYRRNNEPAYHGLRARLVEVLSRIDPRSHFLGYQLGVSGVSHQNGTLRFGTDSRESVLDLNCRAHELDNLYVVDGSFFPSCGAVNPSLTIMPNALRVGDHLAERL